MELVGLETSVYVGIITYIAIPTIFVLGLLLIPAGLARERFLARRRPEGAPPPSTRFPVVDFNEPKTLRIAGIVAALTIGNLVVLATATYKAVEVMDSTAFCGATCHSVMIPEYTAYKRSPHARVECVACHIGPGAGWFAKSKLSGAWQVVAVTLNLYPRPIPVPIRNLRPARETCEQCHWPTKFVGDRLKVKTHFAEDEANTELKTVLLLRVGGVEGRKSQGIHWHVDPGNKIRYRSNAKREKIFDVELQKADGTTVRFLPKEAPAAADLMPGKDEWRLMDCIDCHNRPTHIYRTPEAALDEAMVDERLPRGLPFLRKEALPIITAKYASQDEARAGISAALKKAYDASYPAVAADKSALLAQAGKALGDVYCENVFPSMEIGWGTYPAHIGHANDGGCFRCHDDEHKSASGDTISQDCATCHSLLADGEASPSILSQLNP
ncbi:MAG: NapC/NirT family cytochrome c [Deltaproteobacteria bacterium]|nr:NapC/NirT family cytochrome c [Deltaproteobacteria bacterium]